MAKKAVKILKVQAPAGRANPAPPIGPVLGGAGVNIMEFVQQFNERTKTMTGIIPAVISVYEDRSFDFVLMQPPMTELIKAELKLEKGSGTPNKTKIGHLTQAQIESIAAHKMSDLNARSIESASSIVRGTARSMGVTTD
ncbi:MAG: rplK [Candidatus Berkelbacteria bacterium Gr01-1014_85]|uniref:Large ribosomal subunit protein uL11 n=1 Tax=Candidatus Berkelbacteria bacterium Gr01-1014_85 TaxID=2017150 RepID=A0A554JC27_9BACT|nr:MAG: rplK [Candidatus Berkelbacteria bacterium Gr01-1014_85]